MPNQLVIPPKTTSNVDVITPLREFIAKHHAETHPDAFKWDMKKWDAMRRAVVAGGVHESKIAVLQEYHAQLVFILTKLPTDVGIEFTYNPAFPSSYTWPLALSNLHYETTCVLFNLAALYSQLAKAEDKATDNGIRNAVNYYQHAAGTFQYILENALPALQSSAGTSIPLDLTESYVKSLHLLMLAQAQECGWQKAKKAATTKNSLIAKIAAQVALLYEASAETIENASPPILNAFPSEWIPHIKTKQHHFQAVANYRISLHESDTGRYGEQVARLVAALEHSKKAYEFSRKSKSIAKPVQNDTLGLLTTIEKDLKSAERENDMIYHKDVPATTSLSEIAGVALVKSETPRELDPRLLIGPNSPAIFGDLMAHGARLAIEMYKDRRSNWINDEIVSRQQDLDHQASQLLQKLHLPAALEAMDRPVGLPPSIISKAEEIQQEGGLRKIELLMQDGKRMAEQNGRLIEEIYDILEKEAEEDEEIQNVFKKDPTWNRPASHESNSEIIAELERFKGALKIAAQSDETVRKQWEECESIIKVMASDVSALEAWVPTAMASRSASGTQTQGIARGLRSLLEQVDDLRTTRATTVRLAKNQANSDDIEPRIEREALGLESWVQVKPAMFEDTLDEEMQKYERYREAMEENERQQEKVLANIEKYNEQLRKSRKDDPAVKDRELALQSLNTAHETYHEVASNLAEGIQFYNQLSIVVNQLKVRAQDWVDVRSGEIKWLTDSLNDVQLTPPTATPSLPPVENRPILEPQAQASAPLYQTPIANQPTQPVSYQNTRLSPLQQPLTVGSPQTYTPQRQTTAQTTQATWQPRSNIVKKIVASAPSPSSSSTPMEDISQDIHSSPPPAPWKKPVYAPELDSAKWEEDTPIASPPPARKVIKMQADDWEEDDLLPSVPKQPVVTESRGKTPLKKGSKGTTRATETDATPSKPRTRAATRVPAS